MSGQSSSLRRHRPLAPRSAPGAAAAIFSETLSVVPKRRQVSTACNSCRRHKIRCSGSRPTCDHCQRQGLGCQYRLPFNETQMQATRRERDDAQTRISHYEELFFHMRSMPQRDVQNVTRLIQTGSDVEVVLNRVKEANLLLQISLVPESRFRHQLPYGSRIPDPFLEGGNPYAHSLLYEAASAYTLPPGQTATDGQNGTVIAALRERLNSSENRCQYFKPFRAASLVDARLDAVKPSLWTSVSDDDKLMRSLLGAYFLYEQATFTVLQKDYLLEDMANQKHDFCSSLLVNVLLAYSCYCFRGLRRRSEFWNPQNLAYQFLAEAKRLWELVPSIPQLTTIHAALLINIVQNLCGQDNIGHKYGQQAVAVAQKMGLFDRNRRVHDIRLQNGRDFTAWALFNWQSLLGYHFKAVPWIQQPPPTPPPDPKSSSTWYGEVWVQYPLNKSITPTQFGTVFQAMCSSRAITNEMCQEMFSEGSEFTVERAFYFYSRYKRWHDGLPEPLQPVSIVLPAHLGLHLDFQYLVITLLTPFLNEAGEKKSLLHGIISNAQKQIHVILYLWYLRHGFEDINVYLISPLTFVGFGCLQSITDELSAPERENVRSTLFLIAKGLFDQSKNCYIAETIFTAIRSGMPKEEASRLQRIADIVVIDEDEKQNQMHHVQSQWLKLNWSIDPGNEAGEVAN